jgi:hypothetical protein
MSKKEQSLILDKLGEMHDDIKKLMTETVPKLDSRLSVVEDRTKNSSKTRLLMWNSLSSVVGGLLVVMFDKFTGR